MARNLGWKNFLRENCQKKGEILSIWNLETVTHIYLQNALLPLGHRGTFKIRFFQGPNYARISGVACDLFMAENRQNYTQTISLSFDRV